MLFSYNVTMLLFMIMQKHIQTILCLEPITPTFQFYLQELYKIHNLRNLKFSKSTTHTRSLGEIANSSMEINQIEA